MPDNLNNILNQDLNAPFMVGMVAQAKAFIIDRAMIMLISALMAAAGSSSVLSYVVYQTKDDMAILRKEVAALTLTHNTVSNNVGHVMTSVAKLTASWEKHLDGHPVRITP